MTVLRKIRDIPRTRLCKREQINMFVANLKPGEMFSSRSLAKAINLGGGGQAGRLLSFQEGVESIGHGNWRKV